MQLSTEHVSQQKSGFLAACEAVQGLSVVLHTSVRQCQFLHMGV